MTALKYFQSRGLSVQLDGADLILSPPDRVTREILDYAKAHKSEIIAQRKNCPGITKDMSRMCPDSYLAVHHVLVHMEHVGDVWVVSDEQASHSLRAEGLPVLLEKHARWILQGEGHEERIRRLIEAAGWRHPMTQAVLDIFPGARVTGVRSC